MIIVNGVFALQSGTQPGDTIQLEAIDGPEIYRFGGVGLDYLNTHLNGG